MSQTMTSTVVEVDTIVDLLQLRARENPFNAAYTFLRYGGAANECINYLELDRRARAISNVLRQHGGEGKQVLLLYPSGIDYMAAYFGCLYAGAIAIPAYPPHSQRALPRIQAIVEDANAAIVVTTAAVLHKVQQWTENVAELSHLVWLETDTIDVSTADAWVAPDIDGASVAFLQYTSGSTTTPKGVMVSHNNLLHNLSMLHDQLGIDTHSVGVSWLPIFHDMGLIAGMLLPLYGNVPSVFMTPADFLQRPLRWLQAITDYQGTFSCAPNFAYELCLRRIAQQELSDLDLSSWTVALNGAEPIRAETLHRFTQMFARCGFRPQAFTPGFGLAENTLMVCCEQADQMPYIKNISRSALEENLVLPAGATIDDVQQLVGCGGAVREKGVEIVIVNPETLQACDASEVGEIWVSGPSVAQGYWQRPEESAQTMQAHLSTGEGPFLRTGDLGAYQNGQLFVTGRLKDLIILGGRNYYPQDIEQTLEYSHPALRPGCSVAFSVEHEDEERLVVMAEVDHRYKFSEGTPSEQTLATGRQEILRAIRKAIADYHDLSVYKIVLLRMNGVHKTSSGKVQRRSSRAAFLRNEYQEWKA
ncbi:fatty acyl-AMP ligase [Dictyobacter arantiisoli]|uniref:Acyl-CoA synthetase n=1 Tax=Dictyobacter arantiisoli TaxID=2014874 RepID=A0A5A5T739_9CHLR|nr:fatty acyl-AMP ligase [Dictyobacter arantiisoli]GCF07290.1 acyl-CoA synthetase [Dictyobacter arantiisoli]